MNAELLATAASILWIHGCTVQQWAVSQCCLRMARTNFISTSRLNRRFPSSASSTSPSPIHQWISSRFLIWAPSGKAARETRQLLSGSSMPVTARRRCAISSPSRMARIRSVAFVGEGSSPPPADSSSVL
uniref:Secreted protein n=1 Tax=Arundo donax TaxID=35708 RepID=A0A0A9CH34_ARUDO